MPSLSRRNLLRGRWRNPTHVVRPPWIINESLFIDKCTRCSACVEACETGAIVFGGGGYPEVDFNKAECSFCGKCADVCSYAIFDKEQVTPWRYKAKIAAICLTNKNVECRICQDNCLFSAIKFKLHPGRVAQPTLSSSSCNGCGACVSHCPVKAINVSDSEVNDVDVSDVEMNG